MIRRAFLRGRRTHGQAGDSLRTGQLDNAELVALVQAIAGRESWNGTERLVVEVGTGGGRGSTVALHRALAASGARFQLLGYEGNAELARLATDHWHDRPDVRVVNEYFMHRADIDAAITHWVAEDDRDAYLPVFGELAQAENFLATAPPGQIDLIFIDSVRYTHLAILRAAAPWLGPESVVLMEDDIPGFGELAIVEQELELRGIARHELPGHQWPLVEFQVTPS
jgi:predicted O-methyltransferase YrrM